LFVVPSKALVRYISGVLPALGVQNVPVVTYQGWARNMRLKLLKSTKGHYNEDTPDAVSRLKKHPGMLPILDELAVEQAALVGPDLARVLGDDGASVVEQWNLLSDMRLVPRLSTLLRWVRSDSSNLPAAVRNGAEGRLKALRRRSIDVITDWGEVLTDTGRLTRGFAGYPEVRDSDIKKLVEWCTRQNDGLHDGGAAPDDVKGADGRSLGYEDDPSGRFDYEDDPILLRLIQIKRGGLYDRDGNETLYQHVAIDEAQDRSAIEVKVLLEATAAAGGNPARRSITIAGDTAQRLVFDNNFTGWSSLLEQTGHSAIVRPLKLSYRSTAQVMELAHDVLGDELAPKEAIAAREGAPVELHEFGDIGEAVAFLGDSLRMLMSREPSASVAVVSRHSEQADAYYAGLMRAEVPNLRRVRRDDFSFRPGIDVVEVSHVKGLEFDYVVMVDVTAATYPPNVDARHLLHIGATRAAHQLWLVSSGEPSPLLPESMRYGAAGLPEVAQSKSSAGES
jgi:DNA helicase-2/ATP-dependent DNA helicase PcrA